MRVSERHGFFFGVILCLISPANAWAYLDPGTGSMLLSVVVGLVSSAYFLIRRLPSLVRAFFFRFTGKKDDLKGNEIVFYSEGKSYWSTFRPVLEALNKKGVDVTFLTSDEADPVFESGLTHVKARFIGKGNTAYTALGFLEADVFVLTTPGIDVLQIKRSAGVKKYVHIVHAVGDIHTYKLFSFDYYDAVFCAAIGQVKSLRALEKIRGTKAKDLPLLGCPYLDGLVKRKEAEGEHIEEKTVLVAPTWGRNGLLTQTGAAIPLMLAKDGFHVILRPHPQSFVSDKDVMEKVLREIQENPNIELDRNPDGFMSLSRAAVMVSDISGVIFDYAFVFLRPVVAIGPGPIKDGFEAWEIPHQAWEQEILPELGERVLKADETTLIDTVKRVLGKRDELKEAIRALRDKNIVNFGKAGQPIADALIALETEEKHRD